MFERSAHIGRWRGFYRLLSCSVSSLVPSPLLNRRADGMDKQSAAKPISARTVLPEVHSVNRTQVPRRSDLDQGSIRKTRTTVSTSAPGHVTGAQDHGY